MSAEEVKLLSKKMDRVLNILENDPATGEKGVVAELNELKKAFYQFVNKYNIDQAIKKGKDTVWKMIWGAAGAALLLIGKFVVSFAIKFFHL